MKVPNHRDVLQGYAKGDIAMAIIVNTNMSAIKTQNNLNNATNLLNSALERMSTGLKINRAADDAAGMYVASNLETQIRGSKVAQSNVETGINVLQTVEGNLDVINDNLLRIRDLAVQAANGVYDADSLAAMQSEVTARLAEITRIQDSAKFNGMALFTAADTGLGNTGLVLQVGANSDANNQITAAKTIFQKITNPTVTLDSAANATTAIGNIDTALKSVVSKKADIGAVQNRLSSAQASLVTSIENASAAKSTIMDADISQEAADFTKAQILQQTSATLLTQANQLPALALSLIQ